MRVWEGQPSISSTSASLLGMTRERAAPFPQKAPGDWSDLYVDPRCFSLLPASLHRSREPGARSPSRLSAASATAPSLETKLPTLNQSQSATLPPPHPTRRAAPRGPRAQLRAHALFASCSSQAAAMPGPSPGLRRALLGLWAALGLGLFSLSGKSPPRCRVDRARVEFLDLRRGHMPLPAPPSPGSHASARTRSLLGLSSLSLFPQHTLET